MYSGRIKHILPSYVSMSTKIVYRGLLCLPLIGSQAELGVRLILEESTTEPGYQKISHLK